MRWLDEDGGAVACVRPSSGASAHGIARGSAAARMPDVQARNDPRCLAIQRVGVKRLRWPLDVRIGGCSQQVAAEWDLAVALPAHVRGAHLSWFIAWLDQSPSPIDANAFQDHFATMLPLLGAEEGQVGIVVSNALGGDL